MIDKELLRLSEYKKIRYITDVDLSVERFEDPFLNTYANLLPKETAVEKSLLLKNILPLYLSKGSERSFKYLFRLLFDEEVKVSYLRDNILRTSASKWVKENSVNIDATKIYSVYDCDGDVKTFDLLGKFDESQIQVFDNGTLVANTSYQVYKEYRQLVFNTPPLAANTIKVLYETINKDIFNSRKITGITSGATALVEKTSFQLINGRLTLKLFVDSKSVNGQFSIGEQLKTDVIINNNIVNVSLFGISELKEILVTNGGSSYNVGDPVKVISPEAKKDAFAIVSKVFYPTIEQINIVDGGAGFKLNGIVTVDNIGEPQVNIKIATVSSDRTANTFTVFSDIISDIDLANTLISASDYSLSVANVNLSSNLHEAFSDITYTNLGEIVAIEINSIEIPILPGSVLDATPTTITVPNIGFTSTQTILSIDTFGSLGKIAVNEGGLNYNVGDEIVFYPKVGCLGIGAEAEVKRVNSSGSIVEVAFVPGKISGTANVDVLISNTHVIGTNTKFLQELAVGDKIFINFQEKIIGNITSNTSLNVTTGFSGPSFTNKKVRFTEKYLIGGQGYTQDKLPAITVSSDTGTNANVQVICIMGSGDIFSSNTTPLNGRKIGAVEKIKIIESGEGFITIPEFDLTGYGAGNAKAQAVLYPTYQTYEGRWLTTDSLLSSTHRRLQGLNYYINYSYLLSSPIQLVNYKSVVNNLLHPAGYIGYSEVTKSNTIISSNVSIESVINVSFAQANGSLFAINVLNAPIIWSTNVSTFDINVTVSALEFNVIDINVGNTVVIATTDIDTYNVNIGETFVISSQNTNNYDANISSFYNTLFSEDNAEFSIVTSFTRLNKPILFASEIADYSINVSSNSLNSPILFTTTTPTVNITSNIEPQIFYTNQTYSINVSANLSSEIFYTTAIPTLNVTVIL